MDQALVEVKVLARCRHVNIVAYFEANVNNGCLQIDMEYADGGDMQRKILDQRGIHFDVEIILDWFIQICFALKYLHAQNILHRDLKPQNLFLTADGIVKLGDFGIAKILQDSSDHAFTAIGTPYYLSPEVCQRQPYNFKSDMWSAGCVLYELCSLHVPFQAQNLPLLVLKILDGNYEPIPSHNGAILEDLVTVLLNSDPYQRPSAVQILNVPALQSYVETSYRKCARHREIQQRLRSLAKQSESPGNCVETPVLSLQQKTYAVRKAVLRRLSVATPKRSSVTQQKKSAHSAEAALAPKRQRKEPAPVFKLENAVLHSTNISHRHHSEFEDNSENCKYAMCEKVQNNKDPFLTDEDSSNNILDQAPKQNYSEGMFMNCKSKEKMKCRPKDLETAHKLERQVIKKQDVESEDCSSNQSISQVTNSSVCKFQKAAEPGTQCHPAEKGQESKVTPSATYTLISQHAGAMERKYGEQCMCESSNCILQILYRSVKEGRHDKHASEQMLFRYLLDHLGASYCEEILKGVLKALKNGVDYSAFEESAGKITLNYLPVILQLAILLDNND
ncbi:serine/threonine-protein kinase Nek5-like [Pomacea canaliculata]|uniref:serine/threonine-protein kinase Nek5-like n=1 Tax=Pomacea canaliculata TaxID=400727 RepID=UPI000D73A279|nr:serine/threonine-protein kinase Nek5-like [Pomacea canaliculata]